MSSSPKNIPNHTTLNDKIRTSQYQNKKEFGKKKPFSHTQPSSPTRIEFVNLKLKPPPKVAERLSSLNSVQIFHQLIEKFSKNIGSFGQYFYPSSIDYIFRICNDYINGCPFFEKNCDKLLRHEHLNEEVYQRYYDKYLHDCEHFNHFIEQILLFASQLHGLYSRSMNQDFRKLRSIVKTIEKVCSRDPQCRSIFNLYKTYIGETLQHIEREIDLFCSKSNFDLLKDNELENFAETIKTFGRFFESELYLLLKRSINYDPSLESSINSFHICYVSIVSMLLSAPKFVSHYQTVVSQVEELKNGMTTIHNDIKHQITTKKCNIKIQEEIPELSEIDQIDDVLDSFQHFLDLNFDNQISRKDKLISIQNKTENIIKEMKETIHSFEIELSNPIRSSKKHYIDRFESIRSIQKELQEKMKKEQDSFVRSVLFSFKNLHPSIQILPSQSPNTQLFSIVEQISKIINGLQNSIDEMKLNNSKAYELLSSISHPTLITTEVSLNELANHIQQYYHHEKSEYQRQFDEQKNTIEQILTDLRRILINDLNYSDISENLDSRALISLLRKHLSSSNSPSNFHQELFTLRNKFSQIINYKETGADYSSCQHDFDSILIQIKNTINDQMELKQALSSFLSTLSVKFNIPFSSSNYIQSPIVPTLTHFSDTIQSILHENSISDIIELMREIYSRITNNTSSNIDISQMKNEMIQFSNQIFSIQSQVQTEMSSPKIPDQKISIQEQITKLIHDYDVSRQINSTIIEVHNNLVNFTSQLTNFLNSSSNHYSAIKTSFETIMFSIQQMNTNDIPQTIQSFFKSVIDLLSLIFTLYSKIQPINDPLEQTQNIDNSMDASYSSEF